MKLPANYNKLSWQERRAVREEYIRRQRGKCAHCGNSLSGEPTVDVRALTIDCSLFPENFFKYPVHLHHCKTTGKTIGAVHSYCNAFLLKYNGEWRYKGE